jgi:hypothetical protein
MVSYDAASGAGLSDMGCLGTVRVYLEQNGDVCRNSIMRDIASGLKYLHCELLTSLY